MLTDIYIANATNQCDCPNLSRAIEMRTTDGQQVTGYPVMVFDVNLNAMSIANDKAEYMSIWNSSATNTAVGILSGNSGLFRFRITRNAGPIPSWVYGNPIIPIGSNNRIITEDLSGNLDIIQETGEYLIKE